MSARNKHGAKACVIDGIEFPSQAEGRRWSELRLLERAGEIESLERQPRYVIFSAGRVVIHYTPDFRYFEAGRWVAEEVKGFRDTAYLLRRKMFLGAFPLIPLFEIRGKKRLQVYLTAKGICRTKAA